MKNKFKIEVIVILLVMALSVISVSAIGAGGIPEIVEVSPGQKIVKTASLQNLPAGAGDLTFIGSIVEGEDYVSIITNDVDLADGEIGKMDLEINVPNDANIGDVYNVKIEVSTKPMGAGEEGEGTAVQINLGTDFSFDINVVAETGETSEGISTTWWVLGIVLVALIIVVIWFMKKSKE